MNEYLDPGYDAHMGGGIGELAGTIYGLSLLDMVGKFHETGSAYLPGTGLLTGKPLSMSLVRGKANPLGIISKRAPLMKGGKFTKTFHNKLKSGALPEEVLSRYVYGTYKGTGKLGWAALGASRAVGLGFSVMTFTDPVWFTFAHWNNPIAMAMGAAYFTTLGAWRGASQAMERHMYTDMSVGFPETPASYTSRQRAVRAISESQLQARSAIGNEAQLFHR
jgi:hypothetical protein